MYFQVFSQNIKTFGIQVINNDENCGDSKLMYSKSIV